jgi:hypothetical protein
MKNKELDYAGIDYRAFRKGILSELESATGAADEQKAAQLQQQKAELDKQIAALEVKKATLQKQIDDIEKK